MSGDGVRGWGAVLRKEMRERLAAGAGRLRGPWYLLAVAGVAALVALRAGPEFAASWRLPYLAAVLAALSAASDATDAFAGERERHTLESLLATPLPGRAILLGKLAAAALHGWAVAAGFAASAVAASALRWGAETLPAPGTAAAALVFPLLAAAGLSAVGLLVSLGAATVKGAQQTLRIALLALGVLPFAAMRLAPDLAAALAGRMDAVLGAALLLLADAALFALASARFRRARLLDL